MSLTSTSVRRRIAVLMIYLAVVLFALVASQRISIDMFPEIEAPTISVVTLWPGASASDVETDLTEVLEDNLGALSNLDEITSFSKDNLSVVSLAFEYGTDLDSSSSEIREAIEFARHFMPTGSDDPQILRLRASAMPIFIFGIGSRSDQLDRYGDLIQDRIADPLGRVPGVGNVVAFNGAGREVEVAVDPRELTARGLTLDGLTQALTASNLSLPAGFVEVGRNEYVVRVPGRLESISEIENVIVGRGSIGQPIRLEDVAQVALTPRESREIAEVDGHEMVWMMVQKQSGANTVEVVERVREELALLTAELPGDLEIVELIDGSEFIVGMIDNLSTTVLVGGVFVVLVVLIFIRRIGPTVIIALSLPTSILLVVLLMYLVGYTLNGITLMSMALAIGMVVDNAIVVLENIMQHIERGETPLRASLRAPPEVAPAVLASTLTSSAIFAPLIFIGGLVGVFFGQLAFVIISALVASLITSLVLTPMLAAWWLKGGVEYQSPTGWRRLAGAPFKLLEGFYITALRTALRFKWLTLLAAILTVVLTVGLARNVSSDFTNRMDSGDVEIVLTTPQGTDVEVTAALGRRVHALLSAQPEVVWAGVRAGESETGFIAAVGSQEGSHVVEVTAKLVPHDQRTRSDHEVGQHIRGLIEDWPEISSLSVFSGSPFTRIIAGGGRPIVIRVLADREEDLREASDRILAMLAEIDGVFDPSTNSFDSKPELRIELDRELASEHGVPVAVAAMTVRTAIFGSEATSVRLSGREYPLWIRLDRAYRDSVSDVRDLEVPSMLGGSVPLAAISNIGEGQSLLEIRHQDKQRVAEIGADFADRPLGDIIADIEGGLQEAQLPAGVTISYGGQIKQQQETTADLSVVLVLAVLLVFMVLAGQFESLVDPFVLMFALPFAFTGTFLFLIITGATLTIFAFLGLIILMGVVVNNAIVLVDFINLLKSRGGTGIPLLIAAGRSRLRPVLMTTVTTIMGMLPLAVSTGMGSEMWRPIGIAVIGGLSVSTVVTLVLVPTIYLLVEPLRRGNRISKEQVAMAMESGGGE